MRISVFKTLPYFGKTQEPPHLRIKICDMRISTLLYRTISILILATNAYAQNYVPGGVNPENLVLWLDATTPIAGNWKDASGSQHHAEIHGAQYTTINVPGGIPAYYFDGVDDYLVIDETPALVLDTFSLLSWCYPEQIQSGTDILQTILARGADEINHNYRLVLNQSRSDALGQFTTNSTNKFVMSLFNSLNFDFFYVLSNHTTTYTNWISTAISNTRIIPNNLFYQLPLDQNETFNQAIIFPFSPYIGSGDLYIGAQPTSNGSVQDFFKGYISEIILFSRVLSSSEKALLHAYGAVDRADFSATTLFDLDSAEEFTNHLIGIGKSGTGSAITRSYAPSGGCSIKEYTGTLNDGEWLLMTSNNESTDSIEIWGSGERWGRGWRIQSNINHTDSIQLQFTFSQMGLSIAPPSTDNFFLLKSFDREFSTDLEYIPCRIERAHNDTLNFYIEAKDLKTGFYSLVQFPGSVTTPFTWSGSSSNLWSDPDNWEGKVASNQISFPVVIPTGSGQVQIPSAKITLDSIVSNSATELRLMPGAKITCRAMDLGGSLLLRSNRTSYASLRIQNLHGTGTIEKETYLPNFGWHNLGLCFDESVTLSEFGAVSPVYGNLYHWTSSGWEVSNGTDFHEPGAGYLSFTGPFGTQTDTGVWSVLQDIENLNTELASRNLNFNDNGALDDLDWNFLSNPFSCAIDFFELPWSDIALSYSIWNPESNVYEAVSSALVTENHGMIPPGQGFWVLANSSNSSTGLWNMWEHGSVDSMPLVLKNQPEWAEIRIENMDLPKIQDQLTLVNVPGAVESWETEYDVTQRTHGPGMPHLYHKTQSIPLTISCLNFQNQTTAIAVEAETAIPGNYRIFLNPSDSSNATQYWLHHLESGDWTHLNSSSYTWNSSDSASIEPFELTIISPLSGWEEEPSSEVDARPRVLQKENHWIIDIPGETERTTVQVYDYRGVLLSSHELTGDKQLPHHELPPGIYLLNLRVQGKDIYQLKTIKL